MRQDAAEISIGMSVQTRRGLGHVMFLWEGGQRADVVLADPLQCTCAGRGHGPHVVTLALSALQPVQR